MQSDRQFEFIPLRQRVARFAIRLARLDSELDIGDPLGGAPLLRDFDGRGVEIDAGGYACGRNVRKLSIAQAPSQHSTRKRARSLLQPRPGPASPVRTRQGSCPIYRFAFSGRRSGVGCTNGPNTVDSSLTAIPIGTSMVACGAASTLGTTRIAALFEGAKFGSKFIGQVPVNCLAETPLRVQLCGRRRIVDESAMVSTS